MFHKLRTNRMIADRFAGGNQRVKPRFETWLSEKMEMFKDQSEKEGTTRHDAQKVGYHSLLIYDECQFKSTKVLTNHKLGLDTSNFSPQPTPEIQLKFPLQWIKISLDWPVSQSKDKMT